MPNGGRTNWRTVLPAGLDAALQAEIRDSLARRAILLTGQADTWNELLDLAAAGTYDGLLVRFPIADAPLAMILDTLRKPASPCRTSGIVLVTPRARVAEAVQYVSRGANRVVAEEEAGALLPEAFAALFGVSPRVPLSLPGRVEVRAAGFTRRLFCQTANVSASGMLLRLPHSYRTGTELGFELLFPGSLSPIKGRATVVRQTNTYRESFTGVGVHFTAWEKGHRERYLGFIERVNPH